MRLFSDVASRVDDPFLAHAAALAARAAGAAAPNPLVGCVIVREGRIVGEGFHPRAGEPHAEIFALADAGEAALGAHAYVTLEPCRHHGRTPPCTDALIAAGVERVTIGMADPTAEAGGGAQQLRDAGIEVAFADDPAPFAALNEGWLKRLATGLPLVTVKSALSLDARVGFASGERAAITGASGARVTRTLRAQADAALVSAATVIADDPALTVRDADGTRAEHQPLRVVLVRDTLPHADARVFTDGAAPTLVLAPEHADLGSLPTRTLTARYTAADGLTGALSALGAHGVNELLVEPGPRLLSALWSEGLVDVLVTVSAGGMAGPDAPALYLGSPDRTGEALDHPYAPAEVGIVGDVSVTVWRLATDGVDA